MASRVLLFVQTGDARPKLGTRRRLSICSHWPAPFAKPDCGACHGCGYHIAALITNADRWWLVECENADAGRLTIAAIAYGASPVFGERCDWGGHDFIAGRILASGGRP